MRICASCTSKVNQYDLLEGRVGLDNFRLGLEVLNETLTAAIVVVAASLLLYNLSHNLRNRIARTSGIVLACVTWAYISDVLVLLEPTLGTLAALLRLQWLGIVFIPVATLHLSDALLTTTGLPSRGRRRRVIRILYLVAAMFSLCIAFSTALAYTEIHSGRVSVRAGWLFGLFVVYFIGANVVALINVNRARQRCLTPSTKRRMAYLETVVLMPSLGIFPYSVLLHPGEEYTTGALILVNVANLVVALTLLFLSYPLSFFGSLRPDRVIKADLLHLVLLGPATGMLALVVILYTGLTGWFGELGATFMPFAVVVVILLWQWLVDLSRPWLERQLVYRGEDQEQLARLDHLSERLLTRADMLQLVDAVLAAACDYLQVKWAFLAVLTDETPELLRTIGPVQLTTETLQTEAPALLQHFDQAETSARLPWNNYWVIPLYSRRLNGITGQSAVNGWIGIEARETTGDFTTDDEQMLRRLVKRATRLLDDLRLQEEVYTALEGLLPQIATTRGRAAEVEYRPGRQVEELTNGYPKRDQVMIQVHAALRHYWGGPGLSSSRLAELTIVRQVLPENENNAVRALRAVLLSAIENQRPEGEPNMKSQEWLLYNILKLRFIEKRKARETAQRLYISEANLYRKQNAAIEAVTDAILEMEYAALAATNNPPSE